MTTYVVDASVAAKWFLPAADETLAPEAEEVLRRFSSGDCTLLAPDLFWTELGNIFWKAVRTRRMSRDACDQAVKALQSVQITTHSALPLLEVAMAIALAFDRTVYDSIYVALAVSSGALLVTADERLANALASHFPVRWLGALSF